MKKELIENFDVCPDMITVIPLGLNSSVPVTDLTPNQARQRLGIEYGAKTMLFFGRIGPYKGVEYLIAAFQRAIVENQDYRLLIVGKPESGGQKYWSEIEQTIRSDLSYESIIQRIEFVPDDETELYFKAADVLILPYTDASQSGVLILGYSFGLPVIAADVGSFREDIVEGKTGFLCRPRDPVDLAKVIKTYFHSDLFKALGSRRQEIRDYADKRYSWALVSQMTCVVYQELREH
jgi:glycosyltransferase involved in cell wall biosynthesis